MSTRARAEERTNYLNADYGVRSWLFTVDHKRIALLYLMSITVMFVIGGLFAAVIRLELLTPQADIVGSDTYNKLFTMHGIIMVFFFLMPSIPATLGNFLIPLMIGARDLAFPKLNLLSWYIYIIGGAGDARGPWSPAASTPAGRSTRRTAPSRRPRTSSRRRSASSSPASRPSSPASTSSSPSTRMRAPGLTWFRLPLFVWAHYATSLIMVLGTPVIAITLGLVGLERGFHLGIFDPKLGGDPILFQHLFWFYSHPAVYIMILPAMGVISEIITCFARKRIFGYSFIAVSSLAIAVLGFLVWGHHMFVSGQSAYAGLIFSLPELLRRDPLRHQGLQLDRHALQGLDRLGDAHAVRARVHRAVHDRRPHRHLARRDRRSTSTSTTPTSSSRTSTTSWWAARSWPTSAASTSGGRR